MACNIFTNALAFLRLLLRAGNSGRKDETANTPTDVEHANSQPRSISDDSGCRQTPSDCIPIPTAFGPACSWNGTIPDDVLLIIISYTDIDTFLAIREVNHRIRDLVTKRIHGLTVNVAQNTFPGRIRILEHDEKKDYGIDTCRRHIGWLKGLQLAAIMVECASEHQIAAEDPLADSLRATVVEGFGVMDRFAVIAEEVERMTPTELLKCRSPSDSGIAAGQLSPKKILRLQEVEICARRLQLVGTLSITELRGYQYLRRNLVESAFRRSRPRYRDGRVPAKIGPPVKTWVFSYLVKAGTAKLWWSWKQECDSHWASEYMYPSKAKKSKMFERQSIEVVDWHIEQLFHSMRVTKYQECRGLDTEVRNAVGNHRQYDVLIEQRTKLISGLECEYENNIANKRHAKELFEQRAKLTREGETLPAFNPEWRLRFPPPTSGQLQSESRARYLYQSAKVHPELIMLATASLEDWRLRKGISSAYGVIPHLWGACGTGCDLLMPPNKRTGICTRYMRP